MPPPVPWSSSPEPLCFDPRELTQPSSSNSGSSDGSGTEASSSPPPFDAHAFVTKCLNQPNPLFIRQQQGEGEGYASPPPPPASSPSLSPSSLLPSLPAPSASPSLPLELLHAHLTRFQLGVKGELVDLLNAEYARFLGLSSSLTGVDTHLHALRSQVSRLQGDTETLMGRLHNQALQPMEQRLVEQQVQHRQKQTYLHMIAAVLTNIKRVEVELVHNNEEEIRWARNQEEEEEQQQRLQEHERKQKEQAEASSSPPSSAPSSLSSLPPSHRRLVQEHLASSHSGHQQRLSEQKKRQVGVSSSTSASRGSGVISTRANKAGGAASYDGLKLDIPAWMLQMHTAREGGLDSDDDDDDEEEDSDEDESDQEEEQAAVAPTSWDDEEGTTQDAFTLYQALLQARAQNASAQAAATAAASDQAMASPSPSSSSVPTSSSLLSSLRTRLLRLESATASFAPLRSLLDLLSPHFQLIRDLRSDPGAINTGASPEAPFERVQNKMRTQCKNYFVVLLQLLRNTYEQQEKAGDSFIPPPELPGLLRASLRCFTLLDGRTLAEECVREHLVLPELRRRVTAALPGMKAVQALDEEEYWKQKEQQQAEEGGAAAGGMVDPLPKMYAQMMAFLRGPFRLLMRCTTFHYPLLDQAATSLPPISPLPFSFLPTSFLESFVSYLTSELGSVLFSSGLPHIFREHFEATTLFLDQLDQFAEDMDKDGGALINHDDEEEEEGMSPSVTLLHSHPSWLQFHKRWNTAIYFQLRFQSIASDLERGLRIASLGTNTGAGKNNEDAGEMMKAYAREEKERGERQAVAPIPALPTALPPFSSLSSLSSTLHLPSSRTLWHSLLRCMSPRVMLPPQAVGISARFLKLSLQVLTRFLSWAETILHKVAPTPTAAANTAGEKDKEQLATYTQQQLVSLPAHSQALLVLMAADLQRLLDVLLPAFFLPLVAATLGVEQTHSLHLRVAAALKGQRGQPTDEEDEEDAEIVQLVASSFAPALARASTLLSTLHTRLCSLLLSLCLPSLSYVSRIKAAYRFSRQPKHALKYVRGLLRPVERFAKAVDTGKLVGQLLAEVATTTAAAGTEGEPLSPSLLYEMDVHEGMADDPTDCDPLPSADSLPSHASPPALLSAPVRDALVSRVLRDLTQAYAAECSKCLSGDLFGALSKKLNKRTADAPTAANGGAASEGDKTKRQMQLDAALYAKIVRQQIGVGQGQEGEEQANKILQPLMQATQ